MRHDFEPIDPDRHVQDLFDATNTPEAEGMWTYLWYGPFANADAMRTWMVSCAATSDPMFFAAVERATGKAVGMLALMRIVPEMKTLELGHIWYAPAAQGRGVNADMALTFLTACFEQWGYRRAEWKCDSLNGRSQGRGAEAGLHLRGRVPPAHGAQGPQPRHRLVRDARLGLAGEEGRARTAPAGLSAQGLRENRPRQRAAAQPSATRLATQLSKKITEYLVAGMVID